MVLRLIKTVLILFFFLSNSHAQQPLTKNSYEFNMIGKYMVGVKGDFSVGANTIKVSSLFDVRNTDYIDDALKADLYGNLKSSNRAGGHSYYGMNFSWSADDTPNEESEFFTVGYQYNAIYSAGFSDNLGYGILYGNKDFAGQNVDMGPTNVFRIDYSKLSFGKTWRPGNELLHISASVLLGHRLQHGKATMFEMYTEPNGDYIDINMDARGYHSDTNKTGTFALSGGGIGLDMFYSFQNEKGHEWSFGLLDMGMMVWDNNSLRGKRDGVFRYEGFFVDNIFDLNDSILAHSGDSLVNSFAGIEQKTILRPTPPLLTASFNYSLTHKVFSALEFGVNYRFYNTNIPLVYAMAHMSLGDKSMLSPYLSYGGYNRLGIGLDYLLYSGSFNIHLNVGNLQTLVTGGNGYGVNGGLRISYIW